MITWKDMHITRWFLRCTPVLVLTVGVLVPFANGNIEQAWEGITFYILSIPIGCTGILE